jgi:hypothetical protein
MAGFGLLRRIGNHSSHIFNRRVTTRAIRIGCLLAVLTFLPRPAPSLGCRQNACGSNICCRIRIVFGRIKDGLHHLLRRSVVPVNTGRETKSRRVGLGNRRSDQANGHKE